MSLASLRCKSYQQKQRCKLRAAHGPRRAPARLSAGLAQSRRQAKARFCAQGAFANRREVPLKAEQRAVRAGSSPLLRAEWRPCWEGPGRTPHPAARGPSAAAGGPSSQERPRRVLAKPSMGAPGHGPTPVTQSECLSDFPTSLVTCFSRPGLGPHLGSGCRHGRAGSAHPVLLVNPCLIKVGLWQEVYIPLPVLEIETFSLFIYLLAF